MTEFDSWRDYFTFAHFVRTKARHILDERCQRFLDAVLESSEKRRAEIPNGVVLYRSQLANASRTQPLCDENGVEVDCVDVEIPADRDRMVPKGDRAFEGRVNAKGTPCLYLATEPNTAMAEVRPWIGSLISVAAFQVVRDLTVVDCSSDSESGWFFEKEPSPEKREQRVWSDINRAFSEPVTRADDVADYAPTQVLGEAFKSRGFDGIVYGSKLGKGHNVALFDLKLAEPTNCHLFEAEALNPVFKDKHESWH
jgi:hypothetical protein